MWGKFARDSPLEGDGFELRSPVKKSQFLETVCADFFRHFPSERPNPSAFAGRNASAGNSGTPGYLQDDPSIQQPLSGSAGDLIDHAGVRSRCVAPSILAHHTDGGGLSDHVFAIMYLLGIRFQPRMSSPNDRRLYAFEVKGRYGPCWRRSWSSASTGS